MLSYELDLWGRLRRATEAARADLLASEHNRQAVLTTIVSDVASAYFNLLALDMELDIAKRTLSVRQDSLTLIRSRERGGLGTLLDVRQGEQLVHGAAQVIPAVEQLIEQTENQISFLLGDNPAAVGSRPSVGPTAAATLGSGRFAIRSARSATGHQGGRAESRGGQRLHRRGQGRVFSTNHADWPARDFKATS